MSEHQPTPAGGFSRRSVLGYGAALVGGAGFGAVGQAARTGGGAVADSSTPGTGASSGPVGTAASAVFDRLEPFEGDHQHGVASAPQAHATVLAVDLLPGAGKEDLRRLLTVWTDDIRRLTQGRPTLSDPQPELAAPAAGLTITVGVGPRAVALTGRPAPVWLRPLPAFAVDKLTPAYSDGDILAQVCGDDPTVVAHAVRALLIDLPGLATLRWMQRGFRRPAGSASTMRNLMGQVDGTINPDPAGPDFADLVWVGSEGPDWLVGGTGMVVRRIAMNLDVWDQLSRTDKEQVIGRTLADGTPLSGGKPTDKVDLKAVDASGLTKIPMFAHTRHAAAQGARDRFLRRPYSYDEPVGPHGSVAASPAPATSVAGATSNAGLLFITFQRDIDEQFVPVQKRLEKPDLLNKWTTPIGSAVFAILPGCRAGEILGQALLT
ncbi:MAG: Dyp-type peroxidase [Dermatophilaceae bacterium]